MKKSNIPEGHKRFTIAQEKIVKKQAFMDRNKEFKKVMIISFVEFKDENDYNNFWRK